MKRFPYVRLEADTMYELGFQYGSHAGELIHNSRDYYRKLFESQGLTWDRVLYFAGSLGEQVQRYDSELMEEVRGIAAGSGLATEEILALNARYEISKFRDLPECTTGAVLPEVTKKECTYAFKNWDNSRFLQANVIIIHVILKDGTRILGLTEAGQMVRDGLNNWGIFLAANSIQSVEDRVGMGIPVVFLRQRALMSRSFREAEDVFLKAERTVSNNILLVDGKHGTAVDLEWHPTGAEIIQPEAGILTHANHFVRSQELDAITGRPKNRDRRLRELLETDRGAITEESIMECLKDHKFFPISLCAHPDGGNDPYSRDRKTIASIVVDFNEECAYICAGNPCDGEYMRYQL